MSELSQADADSMLLAEVVGLSVSRPEVWQNYQDRWTANVNDRVNAYFDARAAAASDDSAVDAG